MTEILQNLILIYLISTKVCPSSILSMVVNDILTRLFLSPKPQSHARFPSFPSSTSIILSLKSHLHSTLKNYLKCIYLYIIYLTQTYIFTSYIYMFIKYVQLYYITINISPGLQYFCQNTIKSTTTSWLVTQATFVSCNIFIYYYLEWSLRISCSTELTKRPFEVSFET